MPPDPVPSPCINLCRMDERTGWCEGCLRTLTEIGAWSALDEASKHAVWALLPQRREALQHMSSRTQAAPQGIEPGGPT